jgi:hypothetical protein
LSGKRKRRARKETSWNQQLADSTYTLMVRLLSGQAGLHLVRVPVDQLFAVPGRILEASMDSRTIWRMPITRTATAPGGNGEVSTWSMPGVSIGIVEEAGNGPGHVSDVEVGSARIAATDLNRAERQQEQNF